MNILARKLSNKISGLIPYQINSEADYMYSATYTKSTGDQLEDKLRKTKPRINYAKQSLGQVFSSMAFVVFSGCF